MIKRILMTGASGFVGRALVPALLARGYHLRLPLRPDAPCPVLPEGSESITITDLESADWPAMMKGVDAVIHLAAIAHIGAGVPEEAYERINHQASVALGRAASRASQLLTASIGPDQTIQPQVRADESDPDQGLQSEGPADHAEHSQARVLQARPVAPIRFIFMSSIRAMTGVSSNMPLHVGLPPQPTDAYGRSKLAAELDLAHLPDLAVTSLRPVVIYGEGVKGNVATLMRWARSGLPLPIGGLKARRSYLALEHLIETVVDALERPEPLIGPLIVADQEAMTLPQLLKHLLALEAAKSGHPVNQPLILHAPEWLLKMLIKPFKPDLWDKLSGEQVVDGEIRNKQ